MNQLCSKGMWVIVFVSILSSTFGFCQAASMGLEELLFTDIPIVTVSRRPETLSNAPGIASVITAKEIKDFGATCLFDILNRAPSIQMLGSNAWVKNLASMRGDLDTHIDTRVLLLLNGRPMRDGIMGGWDFPVYTSFPVDMIERIEIIRGPGSVLYGTNAFDGVINIITKEAKKDTLSVSASAGAGSFKGSQETLNMLYSKGGLKANVGAMYFNEEGWKLKGKDRTGLYNEMKMGEENLGATGNFAYTPNDGDTEFKISTFYANHSNDLFSISPIQWSQQGCVAGNRFVGDLGVNQKIIDGWVAHFHTTYNYFKLTNLEYPNHVTELSEDWLYEAYLEGSLFEKVNIVTGALAEHLSRPSNQVNSAYTTFHMENYTGYFQIDYRPIEKLTLLFGEQLLNPDIGKLDEVYRYGAVYNFNDKWGTKLLYGQAYRSAYPSELFSNIPGVLIGNPQLKPEQIATTDWQLFYHTSDLSCALTYYYSRYHDVITRSGVTYINGNGYELEGIELEGKKNISGNLYIEGSAMYKDEKDNLMYSPDLMCKMGLSYTTGFGLSMGLFNTFFSKPRATSAPELNPKAGPVSLLDLNFTYKLPIKKKVEINLFIQNLLGQHYDFVEYNKKTQINTLPQGPGTAIYGKVSVEF